MTADEALERLLKSFRQYYDIKRENVPAPFSAEAEFHSCEEGYFLVKKAVISEAESNEYIFFYAAESLSAQDVKRLDEIAWEEGMRRINPHKNHKNSDISVFFLAENISADAFKEVKKLKRYKSYNYSLHGYTHYKTVAFDTTTGALAYNRLGSEKKKLFGIMIKELNNNQEGRK